MIETAPKFMGHDGLHALLPVTGGYTLEPRKSFEALTRLFSSIVDAEEFVKKVEKFMGMCDSLSIEEIR